MDIDEDGAARLTFSCSCIDEHERQFVEVDIRFTGDEATGPYTERSACRKAEGEADDADSRCGPSGQNGSCATDVIRVQFDARQLSERQRDDVDGTAVNWVFKPECIAGCVQNRFEARLPLDRTGRRGQQVENRKFLCDCAGRMAAQWRGRGRQRRGSWL